MTTAYRLMQGGHEVALYEASPYLGGLVRTFEVGGTRLEAYYHHLFSHRHDDHRARSTSSGFGDRLNWIESKVGWFDDGKIYPLRDADGPRALRAAAARRPREARPDGRAAARHATTGPSSSTSPARTGSRRTSRRRSSRRSGARCSKGKYGDAYDQVAMAWLWSKIHLRFQSREGGLAEGAARLPRRQLRACYIDEMERRLRDGGVDVHTARRSQQITADGQPRRRASCSPTARTSRRMPSSRPCRRCSSRSWRRRSRRDYAREARPRAVAGRRLHGRDDEAARSRRSTG